MLTLAPLYEEIRHRGYDEDGECVVIKGVPVRFLPAYNPLIEEALAEARETPYEQTMTRVLRPEHLVAIAVQTGREKDHQRVRLLMDQAPVDQAYLVEVVVRHGLEVTWRQWTA